MEWLSSGSNRPLCNTVPGLQVVLWTSCLIGSALAGAGGAVDGQQYLYRETVRSPSRDHLAPRIDGLLLLQMVLHMNPMLIGVFVLPGMVCSWVSGWLRTCRELRTMIRRMLRVPGLCIALCIETSRYSFMFCT